MTWRHPVTKAVLMRSSGFHGKGVMGVFRGHVTAAPAGQSHVYCHMSLHSVLLIFLQFVCRVYFSIHRISLLLPFTLFLIVSVHLCVHVVCSQRRSDVSQFGTGEVLRCYRQCYAVRSV